MKLNALDRILGCIFFTLLFANIGILLADNSPGVEEAFFWPVATGVACSFLVMLFAILGLLANICDIFARYLLKTAKERSEKIKK
jgi:putative exporter of polyketide antibiotics